MMPYTFDIASFACGCSYRVYFDEVVCCPVHRAIQTSHRRVTSATPTPEVDGLVMNEYLPGDPQVLYNRASNSLHTQVRVRDPQRNNWSDDESDQVGLCPACYIDYDQFEETNIYGCECGREDCCYRWCGRTEGLHAFWRLHVQDKCAGETGIPDRDIFSQGRFVELPAATRAALDVERQYLDQAAAALLDELLRVREAGRDGPAEEASYWCPWLDREYADVHAPDLSDRQKERVRARLRQKLLRLHVLGLLELPRDDDGQLALQLDNAAPNS